MVKDPNAPAIIGIFGWKTGENSYGCSIQYMQYLNSFGTVRVLTPEEPIDDRIDLIVVPGGADVDPRRYNAIPNLWTSKPDPIKEFFDTVILPQYIKLGISVFGICRGIQAISVLFGARLIQHMNHETNTDVTGRDAKVHTLSLLDTEFKREFEASWKKDVIKVNSMHHQCVSSLDFPDELEILGVYKGHAYSSIEAIRHRTLPIYAVQYHPEELIEDPLGDYMVQDLIARSKNYQNEPKDDIKKQLALS